jgi:hypothetical protein
VFLSAVVMPPDIIKINPRHREMMKHLLVELLASAKVENSISGNCLCKHPRRLAGLVFAEQARWRLQMAMADNAT